MTRHPLDRPIWDALTSRQAEHALGDGRARRFDPAIGPFAAMADDSPESLAALAALVPPGDTVLLLQSDESAVPPGLIAEFAPGVQMVAERLVAPQPVTAVIEKLTETDAPEMLALATLTQPGPFRPRTHVLGDFWGIREDGRLLAMAGERFKVEGQTEMSGVCTHPDARGRGYAGVLSHHVANVIQGRGETVFLHAWAGNANAIRLYGTLGFRLRRQMAVTILRRP